MSRHVVVMGVSGSGKSTIAALVAERVGWTFADADSFHPPANIDKMRAGIPLTDADRRPWLLALAEWMAEQGRQGHSTVLACSALMRSYRDLLSGRTEVAFIHLHGPAELIEARMRARDHFMPPSLLTSQFAILEELQEDELGVALDLALSPEELVDAAVDWMGRGPLESCGPQD
ncbi:gluconokinase [Ornithinimicrobium cryptoxanthini]|uniref:Gluconokinase n=1 Tax=Ornithinimicrobium cryptoxanthini TaxID=2934161 RepID=A0ABY4YH35_9MICO|nr:gluconokinase [Ornithinimicrobium cryptoxanthini]USQ75919.1 gluconokinase [Ornithinimicrobium cryptoxanthini]